MRVTRACICGSDLWPYKLLDPAEGSRAMGHEATGAVEAVGSDVRRMKRGDLVIMPFAFSDGSCEFCHERRAGLLSQHHRGRRSRTGTAPWTSAMRAR